jgi:quinohemoprotein ethanol dehydrogenase
VIAGYGGRKALQAVSAGSAAYRFGNAGRILTFGLDGGAVPKPDPVRPEAVFTNIPEPTGSAEQISHGGILYNGSCSRRHVFVRGFLVDLRRMTLATHSLFNEIVLHGAYAAKGVAR